MSDYRLNAEAFRVRQNDESLDIARGLGVVMGRWLNGAAELQHVNYIDPQQDPGAETNYPPASYEDLKIALSPDAPPAIRMRMIRQFSLDASLRKGGHAVEAKACLAPLWAYSLVDRPAGQVALASLIDRTAPSYRMGQANILDMDEEVIVVQEMRTGEELDGGAGVSLVMIPENKSLKIERHNRPYVLSYTPDSHGGILPRPVNPQPHEPRPPKLPPEGAGDREARRPIRPLGSGSIALELNPIDG